MNVATLQLLYTVETTLTLSLVTIGVYVSFRTLRFPDLTGEGSFSLSAMVAGGVLVASGSAWAATLAGVATGAAAGAVTAILANVVRLPTLLASILTMIMCVSLGLLIAGQPSLTLPDSWVLATVLPDMNAILATGIVGSTLVLAVILFGLMALMYTGVGYVLRARGENPDLVNELKYSLLAWDIVGLALANGVIGLAAVLFSQRAGYCSINMGRGMAINALAAIMLGETLFPSRTLLPALLACVAGTLILQLVRLLALSLGLPDGSLDLVTSVIVIVFVYVAKERGHIGQNVLEKIRMHAA
ncbi:MAG: hypothetical protein JNM18_08985 [Planctomycetaceae bacterium]|nr:hypothetical protein [Planctomycetaceae bacterium]